MVFVLGSPVSYHTINVLFNMQMSTEQVSPLSKELDEQTMQVHKIAKYNVNPWEGVQHY